MKRRKLFEKAFQFYRNAENFLKSDALEKKKKVARFSGNLFYVVQLN